MEFNQIARNPFVLMTNPESVLYAMEHSDALARLRGQVFQPLDKPLLSPLPDDVAAYDRRIDRDLND